MKLAYVGDGNNMANTYLLGGALARDVGRDRDAARLSSRRRGRRAGLRPSPSRPAAAISGHARCPEAVAGADVVITDTWASMGQEDEHDARLASFAPVPGRRGDDGARLTGALFMHCLPAHRGEEVVDEVIDAPCSVVFDEAENRLHAQKALLSLVLG